MGTYTDSNGVYSVTKLHVIAKDLPVTDVDVKSLETQLSEPIWEGDIMPSAVIESKWPNHHWERIENADLSYPIYMCEGLVVDGMHRLSKAYINKQETIKAKILTRELMREAEEN